MYLTQELNSNKAILTKKSFAYEKQIRSLSHTVLTQVI